MIEGELNKDKNSIDNSFSEINNVNTNVNDFKSDAISDIKTKDSIVKTTLEDADTQIQSNITSRLKSNTVTR